MRGFRIWVLQALGWVSLAAGVIVTIGVFSGSYGYVPGDVAVIYAAAAIVTGIASWAALTGLADLLQRSS